LLSTRITWGLRIGDGVGLLELLFESADIAEREGWLAPLGQGSDG